MRFGERRLFVGANRADDGCAQMLCPLRGDEADAARGGVPEDRLAGFDAEGAAQKIFSGRAFEEKRCSGLEAHGVGQRQRADRGRSEEHTSELQSLMRISYAVFCLKKKKEKI